MNFFISQRGFVPIIILISLLTVAIVGYGIILYKQKSQVLEKENFTNKIASSSATASVISSPTNKTATTAISLNNNTPSSTKTPAQTPTPSPTLASVTYKPTCSVRSADNGYAPLKADLSYDVQPGSTNNLSVLAAQWDYTGDGSWDTPLDTSFRSTNYTYNQAGDYTVKLQLNTSEGMTDICSKKITVLEKKLICEVHSDVTSGQAPLTVNFIYAATPWDGSYVTNVQWDFNGDGNWDTPFDIASQHPPAYTFASAGNYTAKMHLQTSNGMVSDVCTENITVN